MLFFNQWIILTSYNFERISYVCHKYIYYKYCIILYNVLSHGINIISDQKNHIKITIKHLQKCIILYIDAYDMDALI